MAMGERSGRVHSPIQQADDAQENEKEEGVGSEEDAVFESQRGVVVGT